MIEIVASIERKEEINWIHFEGRYPEVLLEAIPEIRLLLPHAALSIEFEKPHREGLMELLHLPDVAFFSHSYLNHFDISNPFDFFKWIRQRNPNACLIMTAGAEGAYYCTPYLEGRCSAAKVKVIDATGAGDTFLAGYVYAWLHLGLQVKDSILFAVRLATQKVQQEGLEGLSHR
jgi:ketohexokinase